jgi:hypothetical protein
MQDGACSFHDIASVRHDTPIHTGWRLYFTAWDPSICSVCSTSGRARLITNSGANGFGSSMLVRSPFRSPLLGPHLRIRRWALQIGLQAKLVHDTPTHPGRCRGSAFIDRVPPIPLIDWQRVVQGEYSEYDTPNVIMTYTACPSSGMVFLG